MALPNSLTEVVGFVGCKWPRICAAFLQCRFWPAFGQAFARERRESIKIDLCTMAWSVTDLKQPRRSGDRNRRKRRFFSNMIDYECLAVIPFFYSVVPRLLSRFIQKVVMRHWTDRMKTNVSIVLCHGTGRSTATWSRARTCFKLLRVARSWAYHNGTRQRNLGRGSHRHIQARFIACLYPSCVFDMRDATCLDNVFTSARPYSHDDIVLV